MRIARMWDIRRDGLLARGKDPRCALLEPGGAVFHGIVIPWSQLISFRESVTGSARSQHVVGGTVVRYRNLCADGVHGLCGMRQLPHAISES